MKVLTFPLLFALFSSGLNVVAHADDHQPDFDGRWKATMERDDGSERVIYLDLYRKGKDWAGSVTSRRLGRTPLKSAKWDPKKKVLDLQIERETDQGTLKIQVSAEPKGNKVLKASMDIQEGQFTLDFVWNRLGDPRGEWKVESESPDGSQSYPSTYKIERHEEGYKGVILYGDQKAEIKDIKWNEDKLVASFPLPLGEQTPTILLDLKFIKPDLLEGLWSAKDTDYEGGWSGKRVAPPILTGKWAVTAYTTERELKHELLISGKSGHYKANYSGELGVLPYRKISLKGDELVLELEFELEDGNTIAVRVNAKLTPGKLEGNWVVIDNEDYTGKWEAKQLAKALPKQDSKAYHGSWNLTAVDPDGNDVPFKAHVKAKGEKLSCILIFGDNEIKAEGLDLTAKGLKFHFELPVDGDLLSVHITCKAKGEKMEGTWEIPSEGLSGEFSGSKIVKKKEVKKKVEEL